MILDVEWAAALAKTPCRNAMITLTLTQSADAALYRVAQVIGSVEVAIGQDIPRAQVAQWCTKKHITVRVVGLTVDSEDLSLFTDTNTKKKGTK